jgi:hypothetical protein
MEDKIDLVYLWVDGSDEKWLEKRNFWAIECNEVQESNQACRYIDSDELKYSLRSVEKYAPWLNKIFIVVNEQCPGWLDISHPKIRLIDLKEFIPEKYLPLFSSNTIEAFLPFIPDLSERFLYANDDTMLFNKTTPQTFYAKDNKAIVRVFCWAQKGHLGSYKEQLLYAQKLIYKKTGKRFPYEPHHNIDAYLKSDFIDCIHDFQDEFDQTKTHKFRHNDSIQRMLVSYYMLYKKHAFLEYTAIGPFYLPMFVNMTFWKCLFQIICHSKKSVSVLLINEGQDFEKIIKEISPTFVCINDSENTTGSDRNKLNQFLNDYFPEKSLFEK